MRTLKFCCVLLIVLVGSALAQGGGGDCNQCKFSTTITKNGQQCEVCLPNLLQGGCTCDVSGGTPSCPEFSEQCGACLGFPTCQEPEGCCNSQIKVGANLPQEKVAPASWLTNVDMGLVVQTLEKQVDPTFTMTKLLKARGEYWQQHSENCGHLRGNARSATDPTKSYKFEVITTAKFMEVVIHLSATDDENFAIRSSGDWRLVRSNQLVVSGNALKVSPNLNK